MLLASLSPSAVRIELRLVLGGFERMKQARPVPESGGFRRRSVSEDMHLRPSVLCGETTQSTFPSEASQTSPFRL